MKELKNLVNVKNAKVFFIVAVSALAVSCKTAYMNTFAKTDNKKMLVKDNASSEERLIDYSKSTNETKQILSDLPYFQEGDPIKVTPVKKRYDGYRVFDAAEATIEYNHDTIQIRKDRKVIEEWKAKQQQKTN